MEEAHGRNIESGRYSGCDQKESALDQLAFPFGNLMYCQRGCSRLFLNDELFFLYPDIDRVLPMRRVGPERHGITIGLELNNIVLMDGPCYTGPIITFERK